MVLLFLFCILAQRVEVRSEARSVADGEVIVGRSSIRTDERGVASIDVSSDAEMRVVKPGYFPATVSIRAGQQEILVDLQPVPSREDEVTVSATRTNRRLEDTPTRVEVLDREEIEEKMLMTPGDIVMMLNEMGGLRVQATSP